MLVTVESCARETRQTKDGREYTGLKINGNWVNVIGDHRDKYKKQIDLEIKGNWGQLVQLTQPPPAQAQSPAQKNGLGGQQLNQYLMAEAFDFWWEKVGAMQLSDDAKASVLCTLLIATSDGRVKFEEPEPPEEDDSNIPF
jgi:hypothetical protein